MDELAAEDVEDDAVEAQVTSNGEGALRTLPTSPMEKFRAIDRESGAQHMTSEHGDTGSATATRRQGRGQLGIDLQRYIFRR